jgi:prolyl oligopeptidase
VRMSGWTQPPRAMRFDPAEGRVADLELTPPSPLDLSGYEAVRLSATARDGTRVPLSLVMKRGLARDGSNPCLIEAYGAYGITLGPAFSSRWLAFLEQGGIMGTAHVRGGGEYGHAWHMGAFMASKPNSWRDLIACAEEAIRQGFTSPGRLAIQGGSAGGITVGRAMTERPDLFAAVISNVGINNPVRFEAGQNGSTNIQEFGSVATREGFAGLLAMDSYQAVSDGRTYPAMLLTTGINDPRVPSWQVGKMAARLQASGSPNPVVMRVDEDAGHGSGSTLSQQASDLADHYAFVFWRAGHPGFQPRH